MNVNSGLEGIIAAETKLSMVDGENGILVIGGYRVEEIASWSFERTASLLWGLAGFDGELKAQAAPLPEHCHELRAAIAALPSDECNVAGYFPTFVAALWRRSQGLDAIPPREDLGYAANYLYMLRGEEPHEELVRGLETYLNTVVDHGLNASTFTARVIASTGSDLVSAITGAIGALKGPLHGGAPGPALDMVFEIGEASRAEEVLRRKIAAGERLMGFGHRVYKVRDPRADVLAAAAERMFARCGVGLWPALTPPPEGRPEAHTTRVYELAKSVEATALRLLEEYKPGRRLQTNVEFYTALLLHGLGLPVELFTPTFAIGRVVGWTAHYAEQRATGRIIRPQSVYVGKPAAPVSV